MFSPQQGDPSVTLAPEIQRDLCADWQLAAVPAGADWHAMNALPPSAWLAAAVPGSAHGALLAAGRLADPFFGTQESAAQWVGEQRWAWR